jgi:site-specific recombinase XerD
VPYVTVKHSWQTARKAARLSDLRIHDLRHSAASFMINSGVDLFAVGKVLGHADYKSTMPYSHLANETLLSAVEAGHPNSAASGQPKHLTARLLLQSGENPRCDSDER